MSDALTKRTAVEWRADRERNRSTSRYRPNHETIAGSRPAVQRRLSRSRSCRGGRFISLKDQSRKTRRAVPGLSGL